MDMIKTFLSKNDCSFYPITQFRSSNNSYENIHFNEPDDYGIFFCKIPAVNHY